jgi:hypothetical protein
LTPNEARFLEESLRADLKLSNIRLREGEHQHDLAKAIAAFQLDLQFPDVKEIVTKLYGEEKTVDIQLVRKVQTILKKMEKSDIVRILPKKKPWELQEYALSSFKFQDADKNIVAFATDEQIRRTQELLKSTINQHAILAGRARNTKMTAYEVLLSLAIVGAFSLILWDIVQTVISPLVFIVALAIAVAASIALGRVFSESNLRAPT